MVKRMFEDCILSGFVFSLAVGAVAFLKTTIESKGYIKVEDLVGNYALTLIFLFMVTLVALAIKYRGA